MAPSPRPPSAKELWALERAGRETTLWSERDFERELASPESRFFGLETASRLEGFVFYREQPTEVWILQLAVRTKGQGGGGRLLAAFLAAIPARVAEVGLEVRAEAAVACALYERAGFRAVGQRKNYYRDGGDALVMRWLKG